MARLLYNINYYGKVRGDMQLVYNKENGMIVADMPDDQTIEGFFYHFPKEFKKKLAVIHHNYEFISPIDYKVLDGKIVELNTIEKAEMLTHGKILTKEERILNKLKPSYEEVKKAENTIEILTLLQEVI